MHLCAYTCKTLAILKNFEQNDFRGTVLLQSIYFLKSFKLCIKYFRVIVITENN